MIDAVGIKQRVDKFDLEHGMDAIVVEGWLLFSDGAMREPNPIGVMKGKPRDEYKCAKLQVRYWEAKLSLAVEEFSTLKRNLLNRTKAGLNQKYCPPPPSPEAITKLKELKEKVEHLSTKLQDAEDNLENSKPEDMIRREAIDEDNRNKSAEFVGMIQDIEV